MMKWLIAIVDGHGVFLVGLLDCSSEGRALLAPAPPMKVWGNRSFPYKVDS